MIEIDEDDAMLSFINFEDEPIVFGQSGAATAMQCAGELAAQVRITDCTLCEVCAAVSGLVAATPRLLQ